MAERQEEELKRYNYIGFQTYPGKVKEFWQNPEEERAVKEKLKAENLGLAFERDESFLFNPVLSKVERSIMMAGALLTVISFFLPWFSFTFGGEHVSVIGPGFLTALPFLGSLGAWGSGLEFSALFTMSALMLITPVLGLLYLVTLAKPGKQDDKSYSRIKTVSQLFYIPIVLWVSTLIIASVGFPMPFGNLGIEEIGSSFDLLSFLSMSGLGFYLTLAGSIICSLMALEL